MADEGVVGFWVGEGAGLVGGEEVAGENEVVGEAVLGVEVELEGELGAGVGGVSAVVTKAKYLSRSVPEKMSTTCLVRVAKAWRCFSRR